MVPSVIFNVLYGNEVTEQRGIITGEEIVDSTDCYVYEFFYHPPASRLSYDGTLAFTLLGGKIWISKATNEWAISELYNEINGTNVTISTSQLYHIEQPLSVGKSWTYDNITETHPESSAPITSTYRVEVVSREEVTVPAGIFDCYRIEFSIVAVDGIEKETPVIDDVLWFSVDGAAEIKRESYTLWEQTEVAELAYVAGSEESL